MDASGVGIEVGESIPPLTPHAVSVSLPTWRANIGYEEGEEWVLSKMKTGYPRFFVHKTIQHLADTVLSGHGNSSESAMLFPTHAAATRCADFLISQSPDLDRSLVRIATFVPKAHNGAVAAPTQLNATFSAVIYPKEHGKSAKAFWQHSGEGISSRCADYCYQALQAGELERLHSPQDEQRISKGPRRYQKRTSVDHGNFKPALGEQDTQASGTNGHSHGQDQTHYVEERFGRNLGASLASDAKVAIRRRIAGSLTADVELAEALETATDREKERDVPGFSDDDVYLYPCGMNAIFNTHRLMKIAKGPHKSICFGFPYIDTLKIIEKFGPGALFYGHGSAEDLDDLQRRLEAGERYLALFCEFPSNPLLKSPDLQRIKALADQYEFYVVVDETIGTLLNVNVLPYADVVVSSLTKIFSGDCNVMGGSAVLNPSGRDYELLKRIWEEEYEDTYWAEDALFLERNSRDFVSRVDRINSNAVAICELLRSHPKVKEVFYPKFSSTKLFYDNCRTAHGGYGGLLSATFHSTADAVAFYDNLDTAKGPSLGTNFTLSSPYVMLAHYNELEWAATYGVQADLVRFSVGLEETQTLVGTFSRALNAIGKE